MIIGWSGFTPAGHYLLKYMVTGLFEGSTIMLSATVQFNVVDPPFAVHPDR